MDDSRVGSPNGSLDGGVIQLGQGWPLGPNSRHNSYSSHTSRVTYNSHAELTKGGGSRELHWRRSGPERNTQAPGPMGWGQWVDSFYTTHDLPLPPNGHGGTVISMRDVVKTNLADTVLPTKQRLSVQFPVRY